MISLPAESLRLATGSENDLCILNTEGSRRSLPSDIYDKLANISDTFDSKKDFIGYVDPVLGIVLVDTESLVTDENSSPSHAALSEFTNNDKTPVNGEDLRNLFGSAIPIEHKTMHELAYEKKNNGKSLPANESRPISGFSVRQGVVHFNSSTFNSFNDPFHTNERKMGELEEEKIRSLIETLKKSEKCSKSCEIL